MSYDIRIDGNIVGRVSRGEERTFDIEPGEHDVQAFFAKTGWQIPDVKCSPVTPIVLGDGETVTLKVALGPAYRSGTALRGMSWTAEDHLLLYDVSSDQPSGIALTKRAWVQGGLSLALLVVFILSLFVFRGGSRQWIIGLVGILAIVAIFACTRFGARISRGGSTPPDTQ